MFISDDMDACVESHKNMPSAHKYYSDRTVMKSIDQRWNYYLNVMHANHASI